jgi:hypothetical protein
MTSVYSSGPLGRMVAEDVIGMVAYLESKPKSPHAAVGLAGSS